MNNNIIFLLVVSCLFTITNPVHSQWIQTNGPYGGTVKCLAVSGTNLFAGISDGRVVPTTGVHFQYSRRHS